MRKYIECPATDCGSGYSDRQNEATDTLKDILAKNGIAWKGMLMRCNYCGCVYEIPGKRILGYYDNPMLGSGWHSTSK